MKLESNLIHLKKKNPQIPYMSPDFNQFDQIYANPTDIYLTSLIHYVLFATPCAIFRHNYPGIFISFAANYRGRSRVQKIFYIKYNLTTE